MHFSKSERIRANTRRGPVNQALLMELALAEEAERSDFIDDEETDRELCEDHDAIDRYLSPGRFLGPMGIFEGMDDEYPDEPPSPSAENGGSVYDDDDRHWMDRYADWE